MCYNVATKPAGGKSDLEKIAKRLDAEIILDTDTDYYAVSGFDHPKLPVMISEDQQKIQPVEWGLIPSWTPDETKAVMLRNQTLNARSETIFEKPAFRNSAARKKCCLFVHGFFEWQTEGKEKLPHFISLRHRTAFALGGLYDEWINISTGEIRKTFSIITVEANPLMARIHNLKKRMPLIIAEGEEKNWLGSQTKESTEPFFKPFGESEMQAHRVSKIINRRGVNINIPEIQLATDDSPLTLF